MVIKSHNFVCDVFCRHLATDRHVDLTSIFLSRLVHIPSVAPGCYFHLHNGIRFLSWLQDNLPETTQVVDNWWQTETGGILITPLPGATKTKPGSATRPFFGIQPVLMDADGNEVEGAVSGNLCIKHPWPGQMRTVFGDHQRFKETYFSTYPGYYFTGDGCRRDEDGYYWITGRVDDVLNLSLIHI